MNSNGSVLITGAAGFIGAFLCRRLLEEGGARVVGLDNVNDYYDVRIKEERLRMLARAAGGGEGDADPRGFSAGAFEFVRGDLCDMALLERLFAENGFDVVVNLAAQAGVRYSIENPRAYVDSNLVGFFNVLECCRRHPVGHLVYASSSSVYGGNEKVPFGEGDNVDSPVSLYAATKKSNELMAHAYSKLYSVPATGLRFFTVYGPMGRPDMAYFGFTEKLVRGETIKIFNMGDCKRDFTYVDDVVEGVARVMARPPEVRTGADGLPLAAHRVYNIGNSQPESLIGFVKTLQRVLVEEGVLPPSYDFEAHRELVPMQPGDVPVTYADTSALERDFDFRPSTRLEDGLREFARWYRGYRRGARA
ncbi:dTDP-glucose 4,6-dehydratase [Coriobacteriaceae bacterium CHKCI002]|nr:dTDP-glucose 4,6-dehydratase [Coriobacteriaceae bacterium CHKCI002]